MDIPIAFFIYNRPDKTQRSFAAIRAVKPAILYLIADGPKNERDKQRVAETRQIAEQVDWNCQIRRIYAQTNLSCGYRIASGLTEVFRDCENAIIIEDDIVATPAFFSYCHQMLTRYKDDSSIMAITGWNGLVEYQSDSYDAFASKQVSIWGWATWRRAWATYQFDPVWPQEELSNRMSTYFAHPFWLKHFLHIYQHRIWLRYQTWDFQWALAIYWNQGLVITPTVNLCQNIGFDADGAHLTSFNVFGLFPVVDWPVNANPAIVKNSYDERTDWYDYSTLLLIIFSLYPDIRSLFLFYKNPQLRPESLDKTGWECMLHPFNEPNQCLQLLTHLETHIDHSELVRYKRVFQKLVDDKG